MNRNALTSPQNCSSSPETKSFDEYDLIEKEDAFFIRLDAPGLKAEDFEVDLEQGLLRIRAESKPSVLNEGERFLRRSRRVRKIDLTFEIETEIETESIEAALNDGELLLSLPKAERSKPRRVTVTSLR